MQKGITHIPVFLPRQLDWGRAESIALRHGSPHQHSNFGPLVTRLEEVVGELLGVEPNRVVAFSNCTDALAASISTSEKSTSALIPGFSFIATLRAAQVAMSGKFKVGDVSLETWSLQSTSASDPGDLFVPVSPFGSDPLVTLAEFKGRTVVVDAAASLAVLPDFSAMEIDHAVCFSLHATKVFGAGEGGLGIFGNADWAQRARGWSNFGRNDNSLQNSGTNSKMSEVQAAFCLSKLEFRDEELQEWRSAQSIAAEVTVKHKLRVQPHGFDTVHPYWTVALDSSEQRKALERVFESLKIGTRRWWPLDLSRVDQESNLENSSLLAERTIGLPMFCGLTEEHGERISEALEILAL